MCHVAAHARQAYIRRFVFFTAQVFDTVCDKAHDKTPAGLSKTLAALVLTAQVFLICSPLLNKIVVCLNETVSWC